ncbi:hypothetical protein [Ferrovibrio sp.]|uniref:hypothetical protein n=1 Tax=Ferrovibrio sp. TaxID=1917215 RepID=UPI0035B41832
MIATSVFLGFLPFRLPTPLPARQFKHTFYLIQQGGYRQEAKNGSVRQGEKKTKKDVCMPLKAASGSMRA